MAAATGKDTTDDVQGVYSVSSQVDRVKTESVINIKEPTRVVRCSDGLVEIFDDENRNELSLNDTSTTSTSYFPKSISYAGSKLLEACDYLGEKLAYSFGITSPKYEYEINEFHRIQAEDARHMKKEKEEYAGWIDASKVTGRSGGLPNKEELQPLANNGQKI